MVDSTYRNTVMQGLKAQYDALKDLPERQTDPDYEAAIAAKTKAEGLMNKFSASALTELKSNLSGTSINIPDADLKTMLDELVANGSSTEAALAQLRRTLMTRAGVTDDDIAKFQRYSQLKQKTGQLEDQVYGATNNVAATRASGQLDLAEFRLSELAQDIENGGPLSDHYSLYLQLNRLTSSQKEDGAYSMLGEQLNNAITARRQITEADTTIKAKETTVTANSVAWRAERLRAISESTAALENLTDDAMDKVLEAQIGARDRALKTETKLKADEAEKAGKTRLSEAQKRLQKMRDEQGIKRDEKDRSIHANYEELGADVRFLAYHTEDGIQRLMLSDLMMSGEKIQVNFTRKDGTVGQRAFRWETDDLSSLTEADAKLLEELMEDGGESYTGRILGDWKLAKSMGGLHGKDGQHNPFANARHLRLKPHEHEMLAEHFNAALEAAASKTEEGKKALDEAKKKGAKGPGLLGILLGIVFGVGSGVKEKVAFK
jgi:hypothetical protein